MRYITLSAFLAFAVMAYPAHAQVPAEVEACRLAGCVEGTVTRHQGPDLRYRWSGDLEGRDQDGGHSGQDGDHGRRLPAAREDRQAEPLRLPDR